MANIFPQPFDATKLIDYLKRVLPPNFQVDWVPSVKNGGTTSVDSVQVSVFDIGRTIKVKQPIAKIVSDEKDSLTVTPIPGGFPQHFNTLVGFIRII